MHVSVSCFNDAGLLDGCLRSVREHLPDADLHVVDGRYETWPGEADNSTDDTAVVADRFDATYHPDGPYPREHHKHRHRVGLVPEGEQALFLDADERVLSAGGLDQLDGGTAYRVRIFNALLYGPRATYYPRFFTPEQVAAIPRVDRYAFDAPVDRTDAITVVHRADLRGEAYREAKSDRFETENREDWYTEHIEAHRKGNIPVTFHTCPECGRESLTRSRVTGYGLDGEFSRVEVCTAGECYTSIEEFDLDGWRYLPDDVERGFAEDVSRVRIELMDAGWDLAKVVPTDTFNRYGPNASIWVRDNLNTGERPVSADD